MDQNDLLGMYGLEMPVKIRSILNKMHLGLKIVSKTGKRKEGRRAEMLKMGLQNTHPTRISFLGKNTIQDCPKLMSKVSHDF